MKAQGLARIGKDPVIRYTASGDAVLNLSLAFTWGKKQSDGNRPTQWVEGTLWGKRAEVLEPYLEKGAQVVAYLDELHEEKYETDSGTRQKLAGRLIDIELIAKQRVAPEQATPAPRQSPQNRAAQSDLSDIEDDIPF